MLVLPHPFLRLLLLLFVSLGQDCLLLNIDFFEFVKHGFEDVSSHL